MKKMIVIAALAIFGFNANAQSILSMDLPNTSIKSLNGSSVDFNKTFEKGKVTLVSFWATWCIPCKKEIKTVRQNLPEWKKNVEFNYMTISEDDSHATAQVQGYAKSQGWDFPYYQDPNSDLMRSLNFQNVPFSIIVDKNGKVAYMSSGFEQGDENTIYAKLKEIAAK